jgi:hypothetical protein
MRPPTSPAWQVQLIPSASSKANGIHSMPPRPDPTQQPTPVSPPDSAPPVVSVDAEDLWETVFALHLAQAIEDRLEAEKHRKQD